MRKIYAALVSAALSLLVLGLPTSGSVPTAEAATKPVPSGPYIAMTLNPSPVLFIRLTTDTTATLKITLAAINGPVDVDLETRLNGANMGGTVVQPPVKGYPAPTCHGGFQGELGCGLEFFHTGDAATVTITIKVPRGQHPGAQLTVKLNERSRAGGANFTDQRTLTVVPF